MQLELVKEGAFLAGLQSGRYHLQIGLCQFF